MKFHVGQPVRCINTINKTSGVEVGTIYTITDIAPDGYLHLEEKPSYWLSSQFEPAYELEAGCKVRVVDEGSPYDGKEGIVSCIYMGMVFFDRDYFYNPEQLIVLKPAPKKDEADILGMLRAGIFGSGIDYSKYTYTPGDSKDVKITTYGGNEMESKENYEKLAKKMKDRFVGIGNHEGDNTIFLEKAGECHLESRNIMLSITPEDIETMMKAKGLTKSLGTFEVVSQPSTFNVGIIKFIPLSKNEAV